MKPLYYILLCLWATIVSSCSKHEFAELDEERTLTFCVSNYQQQPFDDITRAEAESELKHLMFSVFDAESGKAVVPTESQTFGSEAYGAYTVRLKYGKYRLVCVGYDKDTKCDLTETGLLTFADSYVPQTFLYSADLTVDENSSPAQSITLRRAVTCFRIVVEDALKEGLAKMTLSTDKGGTVLNTLTGRSYDNSGRNASISVPEDYIGAIGQGFNYYMYLPSDEVEAEIVIEAEDASGKPMSRHVLHSVPLRQNTITQYKAPFFSGEHVVDGSGSHSVKVYVDTDWLPQIDL